MQVQRWHTATDKSSEIFGSRFDSISIDYLEDPFHHGIVVISTYNIYMVKHRHQALTKHLLIKEVKSAQKCVGIIAT